jgi:hypothetical protein
MRPDDLLRALESTHPALSKIREGAPFVGYDQTRRGTYSPILSMSMVLRTWYAAGVETPSRTSNHLTTLDLAENMDEVSAEKLINFLRIAFAAWGRDPENNRLWGALNLSLCAWIFRRQVLGEFVDAASRFNRLTVDQFRKVLLALSADPVYSDWLVGRQMSDRDRSPCYSKITAHIRKRLADDGEKNPKAIAPSWYTQR